MPLSRLTDRFEGEAERCTSLGELKEAMNDVTQELGFACFALLHHASLSAPGRNLVRIDTYPEGWEQELSARGLIGSDPVHHACARTNIGFSWAELPKLVPFGPRERELLERARRFGLRNGFTVPANVPGEPAGSCSFAMRAGVRLPEERLHAAETIGSHAFRAARRICGYPPAARRPHLSRRERECVRLLAAGKTDWEIGMILGISAETVHQYVKRARAAYDVVSRAQLVACGLRDALVSYDEAIPPSG